MSSSLRLRVHSSLKPPNDRQSFRSLSGSSSLISLSIRGLYNELIATTRMSKLSDILASDRISRTQAFSSYYSTPGEGIDSLLHSSATMDAGNPIRKMISLLPRMYHTPLTCAMWEETSSIFQKADRSAFDRTSQRHLVAKTPSQSRTSFVHKFSSDYILREQYRNPWNEIRVEKLVEDLDALAAIISYKHCCNNEGTMGPLLLVTASVDRMAIKKPISVDADLKMAGAVTWVGKSSMEIQLEVTQPIQGISNPSDRIALVANFQFVGRDMKTGKSAPVNKILPETEQEKLLWEEAEERNQMRKRRREEKTAGADTENIYGERVNALLAEGQVLSDMKALADRDSILIKDTCHENSLICLPQQRNIHGTIFGGFLMRKAFELAFSNTYAFAGVPPQFVEVDHIDFLKPVDVGNFLRLKSCVLYTELEHPSKPLIKVEVIAQVTRPELRVIEESNKFYFTFTVQPEAIADGLRIPKVLPATEDEARRVLERMDAEHCQMAKPFKTRQEVEEIENLTAKFLGRM
ncbi:hypothetical protein K2173_017198 [Erythroxylum novogranatense]|uniref:HotDog ACOT-type domain-containing protein n=1 Tax=Erythroxylum novogranatense TaxID=1862640 RepID=A0AAV8U606_9ROSI|nr:hypothetical protein K2173_017198 [Erythroxylum novogranatense]